MKTERLLAETIFLLEHGRVPSHRLAERFEVSQRTITRDMESLCLAGIPVVSYEGAGGGYALAEGYRLDRKTADKQDVQLILTALRALSTALQDQKLLSVLEKFQSLQNESGEMQMDLSVMQEDARVQRHLTALRKAIHDKHAVKMRYTAASGRCAEHIVEPIRLQYRWYAWYLHAWSKEKNAVVTYKLVRMDDVQETDLPIGDHAAEPLPADDRPEIELRIRCKESARVPLIEYLRAYPEGQDANGDWLLRTRLPADERFWRGALLSLGDAAEVLSPLQIREELRRTALSVAKLYENDDAPEQP